MALPSLLLAVLVPYGPLAEAPPVSTPALDEVIDGKWHGFVNVGATYTDGNTDVRSANVSAEAVKRREEDRYTLKAYWNYAQNQGAITDRNAGANAKYDHFVSEKLFLNAIAGVETNSLAALHLRYYAGGGAGYQFVENERTKLLGEGGLVYFNEEFTNNDKNEYIAARLSYDLDHKVTDTTTFEQTAEAFPSLEDKDDFYGKLDSKVSFKISDKWSAFLQHVLNYDNTPADGAERVDNRVIVGVRWSF